MARRKKGTPVHGWLILDKPFNMTSTTAVAVVKRLYDAQKAGHAGTLDPLATGILPIALGEATKTVSFAVDGAKAYRFTVRWGAETTTDDTEGTVINRSDMRPAISEINGILPRFTGEILQVPPQFSAIKIDGNRAYDLARDGEAVALEPRPVVIDRLEAVENLDRETTVFEADCGKGTYVRALARDMGRALGCFGHVIALRRTRVGPFREDDAVSLQDIEALLPAKRAAAEDGAPAAALPAPEPLGDPKRLLLPVEAALSDIAEITVNSSDAATLARGQAILIRGRDAPVLAGPAYAIHRGRIVALGELTKGTLQPTRVFNLAA